MNRGFTLIELPKAVSKGFTLIELLVVITIIVILLALLTPALDRAVYQAQLARCSGNLHGVGAAAVTYAVDHHRRYPVRTFAVNYHNFLGVAGNATVDDRKVLRNYLSINGNLNDPLAEAVDLEGAKNDSNMYTSFEVFWNLNFNGERGMNRLGDRFTWTTDDYGGKLQLSFNMLAGDWDHQYFPIVTRGSHPDAAGVMYPDRRQDETVPNTLPPTATWVFSRWASPVNTVARGTVDKNTLSDDGAVMRYNGVEWNEWETGERIVRIPLHRDGRDPKGTFSLVPRS